MGCAPLHTVRVQCSVWEGLMIVLFNGHPAMKQAETEAKRNTTFGSTARITCPLQCTSLVCKKMSRPLCRISSREVHKCVSSMHLLCMRRHFSRLTQTPLIPFLFGILGKVKAAWRQLPPPWRGTRSSKMSATREG